MLILWSLLAALLLFFGQRILYKHRWFQMLKVSICFDSPTITEGETVTLTERFENRKLLPLPYFSYRYIVNRNYAVVRAVCQSQDPYSAIMDLLDAAKRTPAAVD